MTMAVPGEDEYNLKHRYQSLKRRGETEWENFVDFFQWAKKSGYFKHAFLRRRDIGKKYSAENCYWSRLPEPKQRNIASKITVISPFCEGCRKRDPETCDGCNEWQEQYIENWNKNICRRPVEEPVEESVDKE
jgi:hypothetical protein